LGVAGAVDQGADRVRRDETAALFVFYWSRHSDDLRQGLDGWSSGTAACRRRCLPPPVPGGLHCGLQDSPHPPGRRDVPRCLAGPSKTCRTPPGTPTLAPPAGTTGGRRSRREPEERGQRAAQHDPVMAAERDH
jgi:hypothetical protein